MQTLKTRKMIVIPPKDKQPGDLPTEDLRAPFDGLSDSIGFGRGLHPFSSINSHLLDVLDLLILRSGRPLALYRVERESKS